MKVGYFKITVISMLNFASSNVAISYHKYNLEPILSDYIYHKNEKGKPCKMDLPVFKNDITNIFYL